MPATTILPKPLRAALGLALLILAPAAAATEYDLELVVFLNNGAPTTEVERLDPDRVVRSEERMQTLFQRTGAVTTFPGTGGRLDEIAYRLTAHPAYTVLQHTRWRQEVELIDDAPWVDVSALSLGENSGLKGLVRFYHSPLLYVDVLLGYAPLADPLQAEGPQSAPLFGPVAITGPDGRLDTGIDSAMTIRKSWFLEEKRRLKLTELHYLDTPHLGAIIGVWPIEEAAE